MVSMEIAQQMALLHCFFPNFWDSQVWVSSAWNRTKFNVHDIYTRNNIDKISAYDSREYCYAGLSLIVFDKNAPSIL